MRGWVFCVLIAGCGGIVPDQPANGYQQCQNIAATPLYCDSEAGPQELQGVPGECCSVGMGATNMVGYLCAFTGGNGVPTTTSGGVCNDFAAIQAGCPNNGTIVRCCFGSPC